VALVVMSTVILLLPEMGVGYKLILFISLFLPIGAELINSSIERTVDLVTQYHHKLAKRAKDAGSAVVLVSIWITGLIWLSVLYIVYLGGDSCW